MGHLEGNFTPSYIWDARFLKVNISRNVEYLMTPNMYFEDKLYGPY